MTTMSDAQAAHRIPTLDGWRGIAVLMVMLSHILPGYLNHPVWEQWLNLGQHGVQIFFVLSGYLITGNLLREKQIHLGNFYLRRLFRLMPAAWTYLAVLALLAAFTRMKTLGSDVWACLFFFRNYLPESLNNTCTEHFWTLSLEEQFYLAWPPILLLLGRRRAAFLAAGLVAGLSVYKMYAWSRPHSFYIFQHTEFRADGLLVGCLLALVLENQSIRRWLTRHSGKIFAFSLPALAWTIYRYKVGGGFMSLHESVLLALVIACTSLSPQMVPSRLLETQLLKSTGVMSYSIYIWQGLFLRSTWGLFGPLLLAASFLLCWRFIEQPGIQIGHRLLAKRKSGKDSPVPVTP